MVRLGRVHFPVTALGPGRRLGVWFQGCTLACPGCMSRDTWPAGGGQDVPVGRIADLWRAALAAGADGLTVSGGEPLQQADGLADLLAAADEVRAAAGRTADFLVYTGYEPHEITDPGPLRLADAVVTGRYDVTRPTALIWRGSANQVLTARTDLGRERYGPYLDHEPPRSPMQIHLGDRDVLFVGIPRRGELPGLEKALRRLGVGADAVSWRPW